MDLGIKNKFSGLGSFLSENKLDVLIVLFLFLFAFGVRVIPRGRLLEADAAYPALQTGGLMGFDTFHHARWSKHVVQGNWFPHHDSVTLYPWGRGRNPTDVGFWLTNAFLYRVAGGSVEPFDYGLMGNIMSWMNAFYGAMAVVFIYFLGKNLYNRTTGLASGLFLSAMSSNLFYSMFGHAENDAMGFMLFFLALLLFVLTVEKRSWKYGLGTTLVLGWLTMVWQAYNVVVLLIGGTVGLYFIIYGAFSLFGYYKDDGERREMRAWMLYGCIFVLLSVLIEPLVLRYFHFSHTLNAILPVGLALLVGSVIELFSSGRYRSIVSTFTDPRKLVSGHAAELGLVASAIFLLGGGMVFGSTMVTSPASYVGVDLGIGEEAVQERDFRVDMTIAEQRAFEGNIIERADAHSGQFGVVILMALAAGVILFFKLFMMPFVKKDFNYHWDILALAFILGSFALLTSRAIEIFFLTAAVSLGAGYFFGILRRMTKYTGKISEKLPAYLMIGLVLFMMLTFLSNAMTMVAAAQQTGGGIHPEWQEAMHWINTNEEIEKGSVFTFWWDYGHWMNYYNGEKIFTNVDNIQYDPAIYTIASAFTHSPPCEMKTTDPGAQQVTVENVYFECDTSEEALLKAEQESLSLLKQLHTDYIVIDKEIVAGRTGGKWSALQTIADRRDPGTAEGCFQTLPCEQTEEGVLCGGAIPFTEQHWQMLKETPWPGISLSQMGLETRAFAREDESEGKTLYMSGVVCGQAFFQGGAKENVPVLYSFIHRMYFKDPALQHVEPVFENDWIIIYRVKDLDEIPEPSEFTDFTKRRSYNVLPQQPEETPRKP